jgi:phosphoribosylanthranilate isomerase
LSCLYLRPEGRSFTQVTDNHVRIQSLHDLIQKFPLLELGILYFPEKENDPRNPGSAWRKEFFSTIPKKNTAIHLCGKNVFETILSASFSQSPLFLELQKAQRIQLNINARYDLFEHQSIHQIYSTLLEYGFTIILQYHQRSQSWILPFLEKNKEHPNIHLLLDSSLGRGVVVEKFEIPQELLSFDYPIAFAGGINPYNIQQIYSQVQKLQLPNYGLDLESGARTHNEFDLEKVDILCSACFS